MLLYHYTGHFGYNVCSHNCSWIVFNSVDFPQATNHVVIAEGQRKDDAIVILATLFVNIRSIEINESSVILVAVFII